jgi:hypothetical protein
MTYVITLAGLIPRCVINSFTIAGVCGQRLGHELDDQGNAIRFQAAARDFFFVISGATNLPLRVCRG